MTRFQAFLSGFMLALVLVAGLYAVVEPSHRKAQQHYWTQEYRAGRLNPHPIR